MIYMDEEKKETCPTCGKEVCECGTMKPEGEVKPEEGAEMSA
jgi:hypothetical protein